MNVDKLTAPELYRELKKFDLYAGKSNAQIAQILSSNSVFVLRPVLKQLISTKDVPSTSVNDLPEDMIVTILQLLPSEDILSFCTSNTYILGICKTKPEYKKIIRATILANTILDKVSTKNVSIHVPNHLSLTYFVQLKNQLNVSLTIMIRLEHYELVIGKYTPIFIPIVKVYRRNSGLFALGLIDPNNVKYSYTTDPLNRTDMARFLTH